MSYYYTCMLCLIVVTTYGDCRTNRRTSNIGYSYSSWWLYRWYDRTLPRKLYIYTNLYYILPLYYSKVVGRLKSRSLESCLYSVSVLIVITQCIYEKKLIEQFRFIIGAPKNWLLKVFRSMLLWNFQKMPKTEIYSNQIERQISQF